ncbi:uncharacterized protein [Coffea arabica]|uniref:SWIM-type domain-containing protein n=1 Tax=Coffea arabica TaxID=13443 RepID=A0ABM4VER9_COFAR
MFSFEVHYGGHFVKNPGLTYVGGDIKHFNDIDPDYMSRFEIWGLLKGLNVPINTQICFKMPDDEFALLNSEAAVMYMFGMFRDEPYIHIYVGEVNDNGDVENNNGNQQDGVEAVGNSNINANQGVGTGNDGLGVGGVNDNVEPEVDHDVNESETESDDSYTPESEQSSEYDSDFDYFLDGDTLSDNCDIGDDTTEVTSGLDSNINLGQYQQYAELISGDYRAFVEARKEGKFVEHENIVDAEVLETAIQSSDDENREQFPEFNEERDMVDPKIVVGLIFPTTHVFRKAIRMYSILKGFELKFQKNDSNKIIAICNRECGWRIYASYYRKTKAMQLKSLKGTPHRCPWSYKNVSANSRWLAEHFKKELADDPDWKLKGFRKTIKRKFKLRVSRWKVYRAKKHAQSEMFGDHKKQYARLRDYCATIMLKNPGSAAYVMTEVVPASVNPIFQRMFVMFGAQKDGFISGCRPVIGLDACHLKGRLGGHLMHAVGRDGNNQMYPIAMACVESECKESWHWFLELLTTHIGSPVDMNWVFISDRQKGLVETFDVLFPGVEHRFCVRHMYANFKLRFKDKALRDIIWAAARAYETDGWSQKMRELQVANREAYDWLSAIPANLWSRCMFNPRSKCDLLSNNVSESFNQYIKEAREEPILSMFEAIRRLIMCRYQKKREFISKVKGKICPRIHDKVEEIKARAMEYEAVQAGQGIWEITGYAGHKVVNLNARTCTCREWDITGVPCVHACAAIIDSDQEPADLIHPYYSIEYYCRAYKGMVVPIPEEALWVQTSGLPIQPPKLRRRPGRPRKL